MSVRRMTSYRLFLMRSALARFGRALAYYWLTLRTALRTWWASYGFTLVRYRVRAAASGTGRLLYRLPRKSGSVLGLIVWFLRQLPLYVRRVLEERREDRADLRAERRLAAAARRAQRTERRAQRAERRAQRAERRELRRAEAAERRARRRAQFAEIKADSGKRLAAVSAPAWLARIERPEGAPRPRRMPAPRFAVVAAAVTLAAAVPAYAIVSGAVGSDAPVRGLPEALGSTAPIVPGTAAPGAGAAPANAPTVPVPAPSAGPAAPGPVATGDTGEFVRTLPQLPSATPTVPAPRLRPAQTGATGTGATGTGATGTGTAGTTSVREAAVVGSLSKPLSAHQQREARRQAKWEAKQQRLAQQLAKDAGK